MTLAIFGTCLAPPMISQVRNTVKGRLSTQVSVCASQPAVPGSTLSGYCSFTSKSRVGASFELKEYPGYSPKAACMLNSHVIKGPEHLSLNSFDVRFFDINVPPGCNLMSNTHLHAMIRTRFKLN